MTLPQFLLAYIDSNLVWVGLKKFALPASVNERWSLTRVIALVLVQTALGVLLGVAISLPVTGQLLGWLIYLLGALSAFQGIVCMGLTALCWNQRVARLRENPNLPVGLPPSRYVVFRWMLGLVYFLGLGLITPLAMLVTLENIRGQRAWNLEHARLVAQGERLTFREILGPEIPAEQNAGCAAIFKPFFDYAPGKAAGAGGESLLSPENSNAVARIKDCLTLPVLPKSTNDARTSPKENIAAWSAAYREMVALHRPDAPRYGQELKLPPPGDPAGDVLAGLAPAEPVLAEICAAAARPRAQFPVHWGEGFGVLLPHLTVLKSAQQNLNLRCAAHLAAGDTEAAFQDATNALSVAALLREEPYLISQLVHIAQGNIAVRTLWQGMSEHRWTDAQLATFQERLEQADYVSSLIRGLEGERASGIVGLEEIIHGRPPVSPSADGNTPESGGVWRLIPLGFLRQNQAALARIQSELIAHARDHLGAGMQAGFAMDKKATAAHGAIQFQDKPYSPFTVLAKLLVPALSGAEVKAARIETTRRLAITACALERYRLAHSSYPETLEALTPSFLPKRLSDPMTGQSFRYRRTNDGWFQLYSLGEDGQDDGGVFRVKPKERIKDWPWPVPTRPEAGSLF